MSVFVVFIAVPGRVVDHIQKFKNLGSLGVCEISRAGAHGLCMASRKLKKQN